jgi:hypothetical protein
VGESGETLDLSSNCSRSPHSGAQWLGRLQNSQSGKTAVWSMRADGQAPQADHHQDGVRPDAKGRDDPRARPSALSVRTFRRAGCHARRTLSSRDSAARRISPVDA